MEGVDKKCTIILEDYMEPIETMIPEDMVEEYTTKMLLPEFDAAYIRRVDGTAVTIRTKDIVRIEVE
jgi:hypothetical protein